MRSEVYATIAQVPDPHDVQWRSAAQSRFAERVEGLREGILRASAALDAADGELGYELYLQQGEPGAPDGR